MVAKLLLGFIKIDSISFHPSRQSWSFAPKQVPKLELGNL